MIVDLIMDGLFALLDALLGILPTMPAVSTNDGQWKNILASANYLVPLSEFLLWLPAFGVILGALGIWRLIRFIRGG